MTPPAPVTDAWFSIRSLTCSEVKVRPMTTWTFIELRDDAGLAGLAEITHGPAQDSVVSLTARLAGRLRGERVRSDSGVLAMLGLSVSEVEKDLALATAVSGIRSALADALARRTGLPLGDFLMLCEAKASGGHPLPGAGPGPAGGRGLAGALPQAPGASASAPVRRVDLYANINRALLPRFPERLLMPPEPSDRSPDGFAAMAKRAAESGFKAVKCAPFDEVRPRRLAPADPGVSSPSVAAASAKGLPPEARPGLERVRAARQAVGPERKLLVDCHSRFDFEGAVALEPALRAAGAAWFEEPVDPLADGATLMKVREAVLRQARDEAALPFAGGERGYGLDLFARLLDDGGLDIVMPDVKHCGGVAEAYRTGVEMERAHALDLSTGSGWLRVAAGRVSMHCPSGPVSLLASAHVTDAVGRSVDWGGGGPLPLEHAVFEADWRREVLEPAERVDGGSLVIPDGPGLGAGLDYSAVLAHGRRWEP